MENVDPNEIQKFDSIASRWWDRNSEFRPLHDINPLRLDYVDEHAQGISGKKIIDVGCGGGILAESMAVRGADVIGIDMGETPLSVARLHSLEVGVELDYQQTTAEAMADEYAGQFDVVTCMEMLEHVPSPESVIEACARLVKPGGDVFFSTINRNPKSFLFAVVGAEYILNMLPKGTHEYAKFIKPSELEWQARAVGLEVKHMTGMSYNPIFQVYKLSSDVDVNYMMHFTKGKE